MWLVHVQSLKNAARSMHLLNITSPQIIQSAFSLQKTPVKHPAWKHLIFCQPRRPQGTCNCWLQGHKQKHRSFCLCTWEQKKKRQTLQKQSTTWKHVHSKVWKFYHRTSAAITDWDTIFAGIPQYWVLQEKCSVLFPVSLLLSCWLHSKSSLHVRKSYKI